MDYTYTAIQDTTFFELRINEIIFIMDSAEDIYSKMIADFTDDKNIKKFVSLLLKDASTAFEIYNNEENVSTKRT